MSLLKPILTFWGLLIAFIICIYTSDYSKLLTSIPLDTYEYPKTFHPDIIYPILDNLSIDAIKLDLKMLINDLPTDRYYKSENGLKSAIYFQNYLQNLKDNIKSDTLRELIEIETFKHQWKQPSILFKLNNSKGNRNENKQTVIIGCHIDSINLQFSNKDAPGVDDNLSGIVVILETIKNIINYLEKEENNHLENSIEFHFYSAEEIGSVGSTEVFKQYRKENKQIIAMFQQDMTGYTEKTFQSGEVEHFGLIKDYASESMLSFTKLIIENYCSITYLETECGKICSDHISGLMYGYPSVYALESKLEYSNPYIHSINDTIEHIDFNHIMEHIKLTISLAIELTITKSTMVTDSKISDKVIFRYIDFMILLMMHHTKVFVYSVILFACVIASIYNLYLDYRKSLRDNDGNNQVNEIELPTEVERDGHEINKRSGPFPKGKNRKNLY